MNSSRNCSCGKASTGCATRCPSQTAQDLRAEAYAALSGCDAVRTIASSDDLDTLVWYICNALNAGKSVRIAMEVVEG